MEDLIEYLANKYGMSKVAIRAIVESPFRFTAEQMRTAEMKNFNMIGLGKFVLKNKYNTEEKRNQIFEKNHGKNKRDTGGLEESGLGKS